MRIRIARALMVAIVAGLLAIAGTAPLGQPGTMSHSLSVGGGS